MASDQGLFINAILSLLTKRVMVPADYHAQCTALSQMMQDDISGLVQSLTDFSVQTACVDYTVETGNPNFTEILSKWLENVNTEFNGLLPSGIRPLAEQFFIERWQGSSFCALKLGNWTKIGDIEVPMKMYMLDGKSIYAKDKDNTDDLKLINYDYYIGSKTDETKYQLKNDVIITKANSRWFEQYPVPYLVRRGVYHNYKIIEAIKNKETQILEEIIPYMFLVKKGTEALATGNIKSYSQPELEAVVADFQQLMTDFKDNHYSDKQVKSPIRATNFDEELKHLIPDLSTIFNRELFVVAEKAILCGLGFIDVADSVSSSRRESILNPKAFVEEVKKGIIDFKQVLKEVVIKIKQRNDSHAKYLRGPESKFYIMSSPVKAFIGDDFRAQIRSLYDRGCVSKQTAVELIGEMEFDTEVHRRASETKLGYDEKMYPPVIQNIENGMGDNPEEKMKDAVPQDKKGIEKKNFNKASEEKDEETLLKQEVLVKQKTLLDRILGKLTNRGNE